MYTKLHDPRIQIYQLIDRRGRCRYIGQTIDPYRRAIPHRRNHPKFRLEVIATVIDAKYSTEVEGHVIAQRNPDLNKRRNGSPRASGPHIYEIICLQTGEKFNGFNALARRTGDTSTTVSGYFFGDGIYEFEGFTYHLLTDPFGKYGLTPVPPRVKAG